MTETEPRAVSKSQVTVKTVAVICFTVLAIAALAAVVVKASVSLGLITGSILLAIALHHGVDFLMKHRWRRKPAMAAVIASFFALLAGLFLLVVPTAINQAKDLSARGPEMVEKVKQTPLYQDVNKRLPLDSELDRAIKKPQQDPHQVVKPAVKAVSTALQLLGAVVAIIMTGIFVLIFGGPLVKRALAESMPERRERYERVLHKVYVSVGGYITGLGAICGANAAATTAFLAFLKMPFFIPLGLLSGLSSMIPLVGNTLMGALITLVALVAGGPHKAIAVGIFYLLYQQFENHVLGPLIYRRTVRVDPVVNIVTLLIMTEVLGVAGAVLAVPAVAALQIVVREILLYRREALNVPRNGPLSDPTPARKLEIESKVEVPQPEAHH